MSESMEFSGLTDRGVVRPVNEDAWYANAKDGLFIVSDGMGNHPHGEIASEIVTTIFPARFVKQLSSFENLSDPAVAEIVKFSLSRLSEEVRSAGLKRTGCFGMGATVALLLIRAGKALVAHLGDSRVYHSGSKGFSSVTKDHSLTKLLVDSGDITIDEAKRHPARNQITRYVGMEDCPNADVSVIDLSENDRLLLCSDGLSGPLSDMAISDILNSCDNLKTACETMVKEAIQAGGTDNITVVVLKWKSSGAVDKAKTVSTGRL